jgi:hypothetical protein
VLRAGVYEALKRDPEFGVEVAEEDAVVMSVAADLADEIAEKLERGRSDRDLIDTLAGAILRLFARLERHERRLAALERRLAPRPPAASAPAGLEPSAATCDSNGQIIRRGRGRPRGSRNKPPPVFIDIEQVPTPGTVHYEDGSG